MDKTTATRRPVNWGSEMAFCEYASEPKTKENSPSWLIPIPSWRGRTFILPSLTRRTVGIVLSAISINKINAAKGQAAFNWLGSIKVPNKTKNSTAKRSLKGRIAFLTSSVSRL